MARKRQRKERNARKPGPVLMAAGAVLAGYLVCSGVWTWMSTSSRFSIRNLELQGAHQLDEALVWNLLDLPVGANLFATDMDSLEERLTASPWIRSATVSRNFPDGLEIELSEEKAVAAMLLGAPYLVNPEGQLFKRALSDELEGLPIITGVDREAVKTDRRGVEEKTRYALAALKAYEDKPARPRLGEIHLEKRGGLTLITYESAIAIHLGKPELEELGERLTAFDGAYESLDPSEHALARSFRIVDRSPADRVTVAFAAAQ